MRLTWRGVRARQTAQARESRGLQCGFPRKRDRAMAMLWVKTFHIVFIASWFAGLFYLPRIFVNLAQQSDASVQATLLGMARRLYRFTTLLAVVAVAFGMWLYLGYRIGVGPGNGWMHAKLFRAARDRLPSRLWRHAAQIRTGQEHPFAQVLSLVQRSSRLAAFGGGGAGRRQTLLISPLPLPISQDPHVL